MTPQDVTSIPGTRLLSPLALGALGGIALLIAVLMITRPWSSGAEEEQVLPDILLIDGGKGQLNAAREAFAMVGREPPCMISLAKREEEVYRPGEAEPLRLSRHSAALRLLQYVRDEAHRFAQHYHHILRRKKMQEE